MLGGLCSACLLLAAGCEGSSSDSANDSAPADLASEIAFPEPGTPIPLRIEPTPEQMARRGRLISNPETSIPRVSEPPPQEMARPNSSVPMPGEPIPDVPDPSSGEMVPGTSIPMPGKPYPYVAGEDSPSDERYTPEFKARVALEALSDISVRELAEKRGVEPSEVTRWTNHLLENAGKLFVDGSESPNELQD